MAQICRVNKSEVPVLIRVLHRMFPCSKRCQSNYYEILRIPQDATQKEIKEAFIKLSKEMHPDTGSKGNHSDFVKINEAYSVLCKKDSRCNYDMDLKHNFTSQYNTGYQYNGANNFYNVNKCDSRRPGTKELIKAIGFCILLMIVGGIIQITCITAASNYKRHVQAKKTAEYEMQYQSGMEQRKQFLMDQYKLNFPDK
ncbi:dnaJ homolog subfamily C member 4 [Megachile rotundata]|uniref:dnaJ homolog subfamily C member 4 n=1 Tax=Megachile rotundata TaxID=143995 RepID=UPI0006149CB9|nr:PREDICTED: dnaJ homolog subfamily C member 4-like [Megachile rotundata]